MEGLHQLKSVSGSSLESSSSSSSSMALSRHKSNSYSIKNTSDIIVLADESSMLVDEQHVDDDYENHDAYTYGERRVVAVNQNRKPTKLLLTTLNSKITFYFLYQVLY